uniref:Uncharacterized protein n=2 Tax=Anas TaxID=8835 RepID=A0A8B9TFF8_ANAPL
SLSSACSVQGKARVLGSWSGCGFFPFGPRAVFGSCPHLLLSVICLSCCLFVLLSVYPEGLLLLLQRARATHPVHCQCPGLANSFCSLSQPFISKGIGGPGAELALTVSVSMNDWFGMQLRGLKQGLREQVLWLRSPQCGGWMQPVGHQKLGKGRVSRAPASLPGCCA